MRRNTPAGALCNYLNMQQYPCQSLIKAGDTAISPVLVKKITVVL
jgi:hypothetical protein